MNEEKIISDLKEEIEEYTNKKECSKSPNGKHKWVELNRIPCCFYCGELMK